LVKFIILLRKKFFNVSSTQVLLDYKQQTLICISVSW